MRPIAERTWGRKVGSHGALPQAPRSVNSWKNTLQEESDLVEAETYDAKDAEPKNEDLTPPNFDA